MSVWPLCIPRKFVGNVVNLAAKAGTAAVSKGRVEATLKEANEIFGPEGLRADAATLSALAVVAKMPILGPDGKFDNHSHILRPFEHEEDVYGLPAQHRRLQALEPWSEKLEIEGLPQVEMRDNFFGTMHTSASERQRRERREESSKRAARKVKWKELRTRNTGWKIN